MATVDRPSTHREELRVLIDIAGSRFATIAAVLFLGAPLIAYLSGDSRAVFYVHVALGAFWFGLDFFFKFVLGPPWTRFPTTPLVCSISSWYRKWRSSLNH
jgi:hypothetical protein